MRDDTKENGSEDPAARHPSTASPSGPASAPHKLVVYEDFLCPFCGEFEKASHEQLAKLADEGKVQVEYRPFVFLNEVGPYSARATLIWWLVREKSGDEVAEKFHDLLFANQPSEQGPFPTRDDLYALAAQAGANADEIKTAVENNEGVEEVADATNVAEDLGVHSTPTLVLDGKPFQDGATVDDLAANLVDALQ